MAITTADIHAAADRIAEAGQQPTLAAVRKALGGGSFTTISEAMKGWKAAQAAAAAPLREAPPEAITERVSDIAGDIWALALSLANDRLAAEREFLKETRRDLEHAANEAVELADQVSIELEAAREQINLQAVEIEKAKAQISEAGSRAEKAETRVSEMENRANDFRIERDEASKAAAEAREAAASLAGQLQVLKEQNAALMAVIKPGRKS